MKIFERFKNFLLGRPPTEIVAAQAAHTSAAIPFTVTPAAMKTLPGYLGSPWPSQVRSLPMAPRSRSKHQLPSPHISVIPAPNYAVHCLVEYGGPKAPSRCDARRHNSAAHIEQARKDIMNQPARYSQRTKD